MQRRTLSDAYSVCLTRRSHLCFFCPNCVLHAAQLQSFAAGAVGLVAHFRLMPSCEDKHICSAMLLTHTLLPFACCILHTQLESFAAGAVGMVAGAVSPNEDTAMALGPAVMTVAIVFSGYFLRQDNVPRCLRPLKEASLIKWAFEGMAVNEMSGVQFPIDHGDDRSGGRVGPRIENGEQLLERAGFGDSTVSGSIKGLLRILAGAYALTYAGLVANQPKYQQMVDPDALLVSEDQVSQAIGSRSGRSSTRVPGAVRKAPALRIS